MAKHLIFLVHGMGDFSDKWSAETQKTIKDLYGSYPRLTGQVAFNTKFEFREIVYNDQFEKHRQRWKEDAAAIFKAFPTVGGLPQSLAELPNGVTKDNFFTTHILDVIMYRFLLLIGEPVRVAIWKALMTELSKMPKSSEWSIIAHSLGTAVIHDVLHLGYNTNNAGGAPLEAIKTRPTVLAMIANVSRLLEDHISVADVYQSLVRPSVDPEKGLCDYMLNVHHQWDPFTLIKPFQPQDDWPDSETRAEGRYLDIKINAFENEHIHDLNHYLRNPAVHLPLFERLAGAEFTPKERAAAIKAYEDKTPFGKFKNLQQELKQLQPNGENASWTEIIQALVKFRELVGD